jgi:hypothetical protein
MKGPMHRPAARLSAALIALIGLGFLGLQAVHIIEDFAERGLGPAVALWRLMGYFTILTNLWVVLSLGAVALGRPPAPRWLTAATLAILLVGTVYHLLLAQDLAPGSARWIADQGVHSVMPIATLGWWLAFVPKAGLGPRDLPAFMAWPVAYGLYSLARGAAEGWYPYFFIEVPRLGYPQVLLNIVGLGLAFALAGVLLVVLGRRLVPARTR